MCEYDDLGRGVRLDDGADLLCTTHTAAYGLYDSRHSAHTRSGHRRGQKHLTGSFPHAEITDTHRTCGPGDWPRGDVFAWIRDRNR